MILPKVYKYFDQELNITEKNATDLFNGKYLDFTLKSKNGKEYSQKLKLVVNGNFLNLSK